MRRSLILAALTALVAVPAFAGERVKEMGAATTDKAAFREQVLGVLARHPSDVAKNTLDAVRDGKVIFETLDKLSPEDCRQLISENSAQWSGIVSADECVEDAPVPAKILQKVSGFQHENRIYVRSDAKIKDAAATLVHETNHVANATHEHYASSADKLEEEYRAYWVALVFTDGRAPSAGYLAWLKGWIIEQYALEGVAPTHVTDKPSGNLDNRFDAAAVASR